MLATVFQKPATKEEKRAAFRQGLAKAISNGTGKEFLRQIKKS